MSNSLEERCRQLVVQRKFDQCQKEIETAMAENPHYAVPHNLMGILMEKESNHILAMKHFRAAYALVQRILSNWQFDLPIFLIALLPKPRRSHRYACVCEAALSEKYSASNYPKLNFRCTRSNLYSCTL